MRFALSLFLGLLLTAPMTASAQSAVDCPNTVRIAGACDSYVHQEPERVPGYGERISRGSGATVLYAPSEADDPAYRTAIATALGGTVDYFDASSGTPSVGLMMGYTAVYTWTNFAYFDAAAFGDNLAAYSDAGGIVKMGVFTTFDSGNSLQGAIRGPNYSPVANPTGGNAFLASNWSGDGALPVYGGVTTATECLFHDLVVAQGAGFIDSHYNDGEAFVASRNDGRLVNFMNGDGASQLGCTGDWAQLLANLIVFKIPVELVSFDGLVDGSSVTLNWETASETNNAGFEVQIDRGTGFEAVSFVDGHGTTTEAQTYGHTVTDLAPGTYAFRLKQIDFDGAFEYSDEVEATIEVVGTHVLTDAYPNPFNPQATFTFAASQAQAVTAVLYNALGQRVAVLFDGSVEADQTQTVSINGAGLSSGLYVVRVEGERFSDALRVTLLK